MIRNLLLALSACILLSCGKPSGGDDSGANPGPETKPAGVQLLETLWDSTTPLNVDQKRKGTFDEIQKLADACTNTAFKNF